MPTIEGGRRIRRVGIRAQFSPSAEAGRGWATQPKVAGKCPVLAAVRRCGAIPTEEFARRWGRRGRRRQSAATSDSGRKPQPQNAIAKRCIHTTRVKASQLSDYSTSVSIISLFFLVFSFKLKLTSELTFVPSILSHETLKHKQARARVGGWRTTAGGGALRDGARSDACLRVRGASAPNCWRAARRRRRREWRGVWTRDNKLSGRRRKMSFPMSA